MNVSEKMANQSILQFFARQEVSPASCTRFNKNAVIPLHGRKVVIKKVKNFVSLAKDT